MKMKKAAEKEVEQRFHVCKSFTLITITPTARPDEVWAHDLYIHPSPDT
jgi:hypothetical protein